MNQSVENQDSLAHRVLFNETAKVVPIQKIPEGCADISRGLGLKPEETFWDYDWVHSDNSGVQLPDKIPSGYHEAITLLSRGESTGLTLGLHDGFLDYHKEHTGVTNVIEVTDHTPRTNIFLYPEQAVVAQAHQKSEREPNLKEIFRGKTFCAWLPAVDVQEDVQKIGGKTLISAEQRWIFNSKVRIISKANDDQYNVAPFVVADSWDALDTKIKELKEKARGFGLDPEETKFWIKFDNLTGGEGVLPYEPSKKDFSEVKKWIQNVRENSGMENNAFHPIIMDIDIGHLPEVKRVVSNMCVQAIVGENRASVAGTTLQRTMNGDYLGGALPRTNEEKRYAEAAQKWAYPVLEAAQKGGYRGYAGVDVIMTEDHSGNLRGYVLEMNGRLCSSTPLLSMAHWVEQQFGIQEPAAEDFTVDLPPLKDFHALKNVFNDLLFKGNESNFTGLVPVLVEPDENGHIKGAKFIAIAPDSDKLAALEQRYKTVLNGLNCQ